MTVPATTSTAPGFVLEVVFYITEDDLTKVAISESGDPLNVTAANRLLGMRTAAQLDTTNSTASDVTVMWEQTTAIDHGLRVRVRCASAAVHATANETLRAGRLLVAWFGQSLQARVPPELSADCVWRWDAWGPCSVSCGVGSLSRVRVVLQPAQGAGVPCPTQLVQRQRCELRACPESTFTTETTTTTTAAGTTAAISTAGNTSKPATTGASVSSQGMSETVRGALGVGVVALCVVLAAAAALIVYLRRVERQRATSTRSTAVFGDIALGGEPMVDLGAAGFTNPLWLVSGPQGAGTGTPAAGTAPSAAAVINMHVREPYPE